MAANAACPRDAAPEIVSRVETLETAFDEVDDEAFKAASIRLTDAIGCVRSELDGPSIAALHRGRALMAFFDREVVASEKSWAALRVLDPAYRPPESWMPSGSELRDVFQRAPLVAERSSFSRVPTGGWKVDGQSSTGVPGSRAFFLQGFDTDGELVHSDYHYSIATVPVVDFLRLDKTAQQRRRARMRLGGTVLSGALAGAAVGYWAAASGAAKRVDDPTSTAEAIREGARRANRQSNTAVGLGLGALATGVFTWTVRW